MKDENVIVGAPEPTRTALAFDIFCAWLASQMGVSLPTARRHAQEDKAELGSLWYHMADYLWLLHTDYAPVDLKSLTSPKSGTVPTTTQIQ